MSLVYSCFFEFVCQKEKSFVCTTCYHYMGRECMMHNIIIIVLAYAHESIVHVEWGSCFYVECFENA